MTNVSTEQAFLIGVAAVALLDQPVVSGLATVTYSYNIDPGFECITETPWEVQIMPRPAVAFDLSDPAACDEDIVQVTAELTAGAALNGTDLTWEWTWTSSTLNDVQTTTAPAMSVDIEAQYETELTGQFNQTVEVVVQDSYGCISEPSETTLLALERPVTQLELPLACASDTAVEVVASGGDVYTWNLDLDNHMGTLDSSVYFPSYASTGDSIQSLFFDDPQNAGTVLVTGELVHILPSGETFTCSSTAEAD